MNTEQHTNEQHTNEQHTNEQHTSKKGKTIALRKSEEQPLTMLKRFHGKDFNGLTACTFFSEVASITAPDMVRKKGGQAPSAYGAERGAAGAINAAILDALPAGITLAALLTVAAENSLGRGGLKGKPEQRVNDHVKSFYLQADKHRAIVNGLYNAVRTNGWTPSSLAAVLIDGKEWNGTALFRCATQNSVLLFPLFIACHYKRTPSLAKIIERKAEQE